MSYFDISGRMSNREYWNFIAKIIFISIGIIILLLPVPYILATLNNYGAFLYLYLIFGAVIGFLSILGFIIAIPATIKRLHDINLSGFLILLVFIPVLGFWLLFILLLFKGTNGPNNYGS